MVFRDRDVVRGMELSRCLRKDDVRCVGRLGRKYVKG